MKNAIIAVIVAGVLAWTGLAYFHLITGPPPWNRWLPDSIANSDYGWAFLLLIPALIWLIWDRYSKGR